MSDNYSSTHYRKQETQSFGTGRKMKYFKITVVVVLIGLIAIGYLLANSGIFTDNSGAITGQIMTKINAERNAANLPPLIWDTNLANRALTQSSQMRVSPLAQASHTTDGSLSEDAFVYSRVSLALSTFSLEQPLFDSWDSTRDAFHKDALNPDFKNVGLGIDSDGYNYYVVAVWK